MMLRTGLIITWVTLAAAHASAGEILLAKQEVTQRSLESSIKENARQAGVSERWVENRLAEARELRSQGIDPNPFLAKLSEGLAKRVPLERLEAVLDRQRDAVAQAHKLAGNLGKRHPETVAAGAQLLASGASSDDVAGLYTASQKAAEPGRRFLALAYGAAGLRDAGVAWHDAAAFQSDLSAHDLTADDIDDVNQAVAAAVADRLLGSDELPRLVKGELGSASAARQFVTEIRSRGARPESEGRGQDKADKRKDAEHGKPAKDEPRGKSTSDKETGGPGDKGTRGKAERP